MARLFLHFLGPFRAALAGAPVCDFDSNKVRALLAFLAMERNRPHSREVLAGMLWPEQSQRSAMDNLRYALADLRRVLEDKADDNPFLIVSRDRIQFDPDSDFWLDAIEFERLSVEQTGGEDWPSIELASRLQDAVRLYQGSFLEGFSVTRSAPFEEWMLNRREHLHREMVGNLYVLADVYERWGEFQPALQAAWKQLEMEPWQEEAHQQIMRLLVYDGKRSSALQQYQTCKNILADELDVEPSEQTQRLYESIRDGTLYIPFHLTRPHLLPGEISATHLTSSIFARDEELRKMDQCLLDCQNGRGLALFVTGEAGSGKTTLVKEFIHRSMRQSPGLVAAYTNCNAITGTSDPYLPFIEMIEMLTGDVDQAWIVGSESRDVAIRLWSAAPEAVQGIIESGPDLAGRFVAGEALLARARALPHVNTDRLEKVLQKNASRLSHTLPGSSGMQQSALFEQVLGVFKHIARRRMLLLILDDLQWADSDTVNLLFFLCRRLSGSRVMILGVFRQEELSIDAGGKPPPFLSVLRELQTGFACQIINLSQSDGGRFIQCLLDSEPNRLGMEFRKTLERMTNGIPLFSIELLRAMQARGDLARNECGQWVETGQLNWDQLPARIEAVIAEQVDRLPAAWQTALAVASVVGDDFTAETVAQVLSIEPQVLMQQLSGPIAKHHHMVYASGVQPLAGKGTRLSRYRFRHHLFQKFFYQRQDEVERARRHEAVGYALESSYGEQAGEYAISLAQHFEHAGMQVKAAGYLLQAGKKAVTLFANESAIAHFHKGLELLNAVAQSPERDSLELSLLIALGGPLIATQGYLSSELERIFTRAGKLAKKGENDTELFWMLSLLKSYYNLRGDPRNSKEIAARILKIARHSKDAGLLITAHSRMISNCLYYGQWRALQKHLKQITRLYDPEQHRWVVYQLGADPMSTAFSNAALGTWILGYADQARIYCQAALELTRDLGHPMAAWFALYYSVHFYINNGITSEAQANIEKALQICDQQDLRYYRDLMEALQGWILANAGDETGIPILEQGVNQLRQTGDRMNLLMYLRLQAGAYLNDHRISPALNTIDEALRLTKETQIIYEKPELIRLKGEILLARSTDSAQEAEEWFRRAIECAVLQKTRMWELRATVNLARLLLETGRGDDAYTRLKAIVDWFTEGFNTVDLIKARKLLEDLDFQRR